MQKKRAHLVCEDLIVRTVSLDRFVASSFRADEILGFGDTSRAYGDELVSDICDTSTCILFSVEREVA